MFNVKHVTFQEGWRVVCQCLSRIVISKFENSQENFY